MLNETNNEFFFLFLVASFTQAVTSKSDKDEFDKIIAIMKTKSPADLRKYFGEPNEKSNEKGKSEVQILRYIEPLIDAYLNIKENKLSHLTFFYWKDLDNYSALKTRFKNFKWIETKLHDNLKSDVLTDLYLVKVPEINMEFQYDNNAPKRKVMWILFE
ncbi:MAG TPA: hypothetical protein VNJ01_16510 [Bacteriovoracaceae bacterium]|nr:hypothetical protein [Bacteriovoracaceae bacterium]